MITKSFFSTKSSFLFCIEELKFKVDTLLEDYDFLIFSIYPTYSTHNVSEIIKKVFKTDNFVAFHTSNVFIDDKIKEKGVGVFAIKFEKKGKIETFYVDNYDSKSLEKTSSYLNQNSNKFHIFIACNNKVCDFIEKLSHKLKYYPINNIAGGVLSGLISHMEYLNYIFTPTKVLREGLFIISFEGISWEIGISSGFMPYGITYKIAKAYKRRIYTVDDGKNFGYICKKLLDGIDNIDIKYTWYTPIYVLNEENGHIASVRTVKNITDKYVEFYANVKKGEYFKLSFATKEDLFKEDDKIACEMLDRLENVEATFNFSCIARQYVLEDKQEKEIEIYTNTFDSHLFGFFTAGEIAPDVKYENLIFYNETSIPVTLKENE